MEKKIILFAILVMVIISVLFLSSEKPISINEYMQKKHFMNWETNPEYMNNATKEVWFIQDFDGYNAGDIMIIEDTIAEIEYRLYSSYGWCTDIGFYYNITSREYGYLKGYEHFYFEGDLTNIFSAGEKVKMIFHIVGINDTIVITPENKEKYYDLPVGWTLHYDVETLAKQGTINGEKVTFVE